MEGYAQRLLKDIKLKEKNEQITNRQTENVNNAGKQCTSFFFSLRVPPVVKDEVMA